MNAFGAHSLESDHANGREAPLPASLESYPRRPGPGPRLNAGGPLFYGVFATTPTELVVERADGSTLYTESLAVKAKEEAEYCEGYAEPR